MSITLLLKFESGVLKGLKFSVEQIIPRPEVPKPTRSAAENEEEQVTGIPDKRERNRKRFLLWKALPTSMKK
jgi:hypothetical protein